jgi:hypothetical protein
MASQVAHIVYAQKYFDKYPSTINKDQFLLGCVFPDIRRIDPKVKRRDTHLILGELNLDFSYLDSFHAGWKFHLYCDMRREEILNEFGFYAEEGTAELLNLPAKLLEDELLYGQYENWEKVTQYFRDTPAVESGLNVSRETFELWYAIVAKYIETCPNSRTMGIFLSKQPDLVPISKHVVELVDKLRGNDKVIGLLQEIANRIV